MKHSFEKLVMEKGEYRVAFEWIGEGWTGDYNEKDPEDTPLLRFSCHEFVDGGWQEMNDASYCTQLPIDTPIRFLAIAQTSILEAIKDCNYKRKLEKLSWLCLDDFEKYK